MIHDLEVTELMQSIAKQSQKLMEDMRNNQNALPALSKQFIELTQDFQLLTSALVKQPDALLQSQMAYWQDAAGLFQSQISHWFEGTHMPIDDPRFKSEEWVTNPFYNLLSQHYLLASEHFNALLEQIDFGDNNVAKRMKFFVQQYLDALSPANFVHTNPQLIAETIQSHGKNLLRGLQNLLTDIDGGSSRLIVKMTDTSAFKIGENLATTKGKVIFRNEMIELIQYTPQTEKTHQIPLLLMPPWINKYYILDLSAHNSLVNYLVQQGITVFIISWVNPDKSYAEKGLFSYMNLGPIAAIDVIKKQLNVEKVNTLGFCIGGTLQAMLLAYNKAHDKSCINSATFLASMIDFSDAGDISVYIDEQQIRKIEETMKTHGFLDGKFMASTFNSLRANDLIWSFFIKNYLQGKQSVPFDILYWNADCTNMPAKMHSQYLRWMYLHNRLIKPGKIKVNHTPLDVHQIDTPTFFVSTKRDHIAPWPTTYNGYLAMKGPKEFVLGGSGHIAGIINPATSEKYGYWTNPNVAATTDDWLKDAIQHDGSWWAYWLKWLKKHSGKKITAPQFEALPFKGLMDAPGRYVVSIIKE